MSDLFVYRYGVKERVISKYTSLDTVIRVYFPEILNSIFDVMLHYPDGAVYPARKECPLYRYNARVVEFIINNDPIKDKQGMTKKFWMVQAVPGNPATAKHETKESAVNEAIRLAGLDGNSGKEFVVMEAISVHAVSKPPVVSKTLNK